MFLIYSKDKLPAAFAENRGKDRENADKTQTPAQDTVYYLGIDGGATKTSLCLTDVSGRTIRCLTVGSANPFDIGMEKAKSTLRHAITEITEGIPLSSVYMFAGLSGGSSGATNEQFLAFFDTFPFAAFENGSDNENLIAAGLHGGNGITVILGTGICVFSVCNGHIHRIGGWGYLFDDGGSGYNLGRDAVHSYFAALDGTGESTVLTARIEAKANCGGQKLLGLLYEGGKREIASYAPLVLTAAEQGDAVAVSICRRNIGYAADCIRTGARDFPASCREISVVCAGGLTENQYYFTALKDALAEDDRLRVTILGCEPVVGAVERARQLYEKTKRKRGDVQC